jgi:HK97 family phage prohead protease
MPTSSIMLAQHDLNQPIGRWPEIGVVGGRLEALGEFPPEGVSERADLYCGLVKSGVVSAVSIGFCPISGEPIRGGGWRHTKWELVELSLVSVPANPAALITERSYRSRHAADDPIRELGGIIGRMARAARLRNALSPTSMQQWERVEIARKLRERW